MLGKKIITIIDTYKVRLQNKEDGLIEDLFQLVEQSEISRLETFYILTKGLEYCDTMADDIIIKSKKWNNVDLTKEFLESCYYDEEIWK